MSSTPPSQPVNAFRVSFSSRLGFILAAAGSAVGLGNIWSFPTQAAQTGGGAFVLMYLVLSLILAYPVLVAELVIGRYGQGNPVTALERIPSNPKWKKVTRVSAVIAVLFVCLIFAFYSIVGGWLLALPSALSWSLLGCLLGRGWLTEFSCSEICCWQWFLSG